MLMKDLTDVRFGRLVAKKLAEKDKWGHIQWECKCDCGKIHIVRSYDLIVGNTKSCKCFQNIRRPKTKKKKTSKYKGVCWSKTNKKWVTHIAFQKKFYYLGGFDDEEEAAQAYNAKAIELFGDNAWLNPV